jgi:DNA-binding transcriptional LysR family regulator
MDSLGIEAFLAIVKTRNLTKAAEMLHLSQSTVSHRLQVLERSVNASLVERGKGRQTIGLTPFGNSFIAIAERWSLLNRELAFLQASGSQIRLTLGGADSLNLYVLPPLYQAIVQSFPNVSLRVITQHTMESYQCIERRDVDMAFVNIEKVVPGIVVEPFYMDKMVLVRLATDTRSMGDVLSPMELDRRHELYFNWGPAYQLWRDRWWDEGDSSRLQVDAAALLFTLMWDERQWAVVPKSIVNIFANPKKFVVQQLAEPAPPRVCYKLRHKHQEVVKEPFLSEIDRLIKTMFSCEELENQ